MTDMLITTLRAERGAKYDETGQCISSYNRSIVFMPRAAKPDEVVRVRLIPIEGKTDRNGRVMYYSEYAPPELSVAHRNAIAKEASGLRHSNALRREQGEAILRAKGVAGGTGFDWYYFCGEETFGSAFSPAALMALELLPCASEVGLTELIAWIAESGYYSATQERGEQRTPDIPEQRLAELAERIDHAERVLSVRVE